MNDVISRRGVYYDLSQSPYEYLTPYGDLFKFRSQKRLDMYTRDIVKEIEKLEKLLERNDLQDFLPCEMLELLIKSIYKALYNKIEG